MMVDLPARRLAETAPFTHSEVDIFGPFIVMLRRSEARRYGLCLLVGQVGLCISKLRSPWILTRLSLH